MQTIPKTNLRHIKQQQQNHQKYDTPGPGSYDIALPLIRPNYEAIRKNNDVVILKINHHGQSCNFRSQMDRFPDQKQKSPGPGKYSMNLKNLKNKKIQNKRYSQRYTDLIDFMYRDRIHMSPIPDYKVQYDNSYQKQLQQIKNSHRRHLQKQKNKDNQIETQKQKNKKSLSICSTNNIIHIKSTSRLAMQASQNSNHPSLYGSIKIIQNQQNKTIIPKKQLRTIDFPQQSSAMKSAKRALPLQKQQKLLLHRMTLYNRNMVGMLMIKSKQKNKQRKQSMLSLIDSQIDKKNRYDIDLSTFDNS